MKEKIENGFLYHSCGKKVVEINGNSTMLNVPIYCKRCKCTFKVDIVDGKIKG